MATIYKVEIVSFRVNYPSKKLQRILEKALHDEDLNEVNVRVEKQ